MTLVLIQNPCLPKYRPLSSPLKAAYLPVTSYIFLTSETCQLNENKMENKQYTEQELQQLHAVLYDILAEIDRVCRENDIRYFIIGGTAIGAHFFDGIIPGTMT